MIIGQDKLLTKLNTFSLSTLPRTIMFIGDWGCGKHTIAKYLAAKFDLSFLEVDSTFDHDRIIDIYQKPIKTLIYIDISKVTIKQQNQFLKFIEEPSNNMYVVVGANSTSGVLDTILSRCLKYYFESYTIDQLKQVKKFSDKNLMLYNICKTPGQLLADSSDNINEIYSLCSLLVEKIDQASWANTLKIETKINYKEDYNKFDFLLFLNTLEYVAFQSYISESPSKNAFTIYEITNNAKQLLLNKNIAKENFIINFLTTLWKETR